MILYLQSHSIDRFGDMKRERFLRRQICKWCKLTREPVSGLNESINCVDYQPSSRFHDFVFIEHAQQWFKNNHALADLKFNWKAVMKKSTKMSGVDFQFIHKDVAFRYTTASHLGFGPIILNGASAAGNL